MINLIKMRLYYPAIILLLVSVPVFSQTDDFFKVIYTSPYPGSLENTLESNIIIRTNKLIDLTSLYPTFLRVTGSKSGLHSGKLLTADDGRTILFYSNNKFISDEIISVKSDKPLKSLNGEEIDSLSFSFGTINKTGNENAEYKYKLHSGFISTESMNHSPEIEKIEADSLPADFPRVNITVSDNPHPDYLFLGTTAKTAYLMILDNSGNPVYYKKTPSGTYDFKVQPNGTLTYYDMKSSSFIVMDSSYSTIDTIRGGNGYYTDLHELRILPNGHSLIISFIDRIMDLSRIVEGGSTEAIVVGSVIQELDQNKNVVFQWRCQDYFNVKDTYTDLRLSYIDYTHANAIDLDDDGNLLVSFRNMQEITKINRETGKIIWRFGGKNNQFTFLNDTLGFSWQHAIRRLTNGNFILFDNGFKREKDNYSRVLEYKLDEKLKTADLVWSYRNTPDVYSYGLGYAQRLNNGNTLIGWGTEVPSVTEVRPDGSKAFEMSLPSNLMTYRVYRFPWKNKTRPEHKLSFSHYEYNFETKAPGDTVSFLMDIKNNNNENIAINSLSNNTRDFYTLLNFPVTVPANGDIKVRFYFKPINPGSVKDTFIINYDNGTEKIALSGNAVISGNNKLDQIPEQYSLHQNYPNPFNLSTTITYDLPEGGNVALTIYNLLGEIVVKLVNSYQKAGRYSKKWNGLDNKGSEVPSGIYLYNIQAGEFRLSKKMILLK